MFDFVPVEAPSLDVLARTVDAGFSTLVPDSNNGMDLVGLDQIKESQQTLGFNTS